MKSLQKLLNTESGRILVSVLLGLGLAALFRKACVDSNCLVIRGPDPQEVQKYHYKVNDTCYKYTHVITECG